MAGYEMALWRGQLNPRWATSARGGAFGQLIWMPLMARLITSRCTSDVPSKMV